jgi:hypothetical protein
MKRVRWFSLAFLAVVMAVNASAINILTNPGFEAGLSGWTIINQVAPGGVMSSGNWFDATTTTSPLSVLPTAGPNAGNHYAITDQQNTGSGGTRTLSQTFVVPVTTQIILSFWLFVNDQSNSLPVNNGLDFLQPNHHTRVDILSGGAGPFDTGAGVVANLFLGNGLSNNQPPLFGGCNIAAPPNFCPWRFYSFDVTGILIPGQTYTLRFADVNGENFTSFYATGVDEVSLDVLVPEPNTFVFGGIGIALLLVARKRLGIKR